MIKGYLWAKLWLKSVRQLTYQKQEKKLCETKKTRKDTEKAVKLSVRNETLKNERITTHIFLHSHIITLNQNLKHMLSALPSHPAFIFLKKNCNSILHHQYYHKVFLIIFFCFRMWYTQSNMKSKRPVFLAKNYLIIKTVK